jgi:phosphoribosylformylglycinamidine synthase subunit PurQ / glutaminase
MHTPNVLVLRAPGTNCDAETAMAFQQAGGQPETLHINRLLEKPSLFQQFQILCVPGGFSYGDDLGAGRILGNQIQHHLAEELARFKAEGKLMLGICNGFQVLMKSPVLLDNDAAKGPAATLTLNDCGRYHDCWVRLEVHGSKCVFLQGIEQMYLPVAHAEGKFVARDEKTLDQLDSAGQLVLRYVAADNPNGAELHVAGVCDATGRVLGLMPHPERHIDPTQHPRWTRHEAGQGGDGLKLFTNAVRYFA